MWGNPSRTVRTERGEKEFHRLTIKLLMNIDEKIFRFETKFKSMNKKRSQLSKTLEADRIVFDKDRGNY
jgi:hypothetical protein